MIKLDTERFILSTASRDEMQEIIDKEADEMRQTSWDTFDCHKLVLAVEILFIVVRLLQMPNRSVGHSSHVAGQGLQKLPFKVSNDSFFPVAIGCAFAFFVPPIKEQPIPVP